MMVIIFCFLLFAGGDGGGDLGGAGALAVVLTCQARRGGEDA